MNPTRIVILLAYAIVFLLAGIGLDTWWRAAQFGVDHVDKGTSAFEHVVTACALLAAGWFFLDKAAQGYHINNLKLAIKCERQMSPQGGDFLAIQINLSKGDKGSLTIHDARVRVTFMSGRHVIPFPGVHRSQTVSANGRLHIPNLDTPEALIPMLNLPPNEETHFATSVVVCSGEVCFVEVAIVGQLYGTDYHGQWKASMIVLPVPTLSVTPSPGPPVPSATGFPLYKSRRRGRGGPA